MQLLGQVGQYGTMGHSGSCSPEAVVHMKGRVLQLACPAAAPGLVGQPGRPRTRTGTRNNPVHKNLHYPVQCNICTEKY
jgi:hypothetical protein